MDGCIMGLISINTWVLTTLDLSAGELLRSKATLALLPLKSRAMVACS